MLPGLSMACSGTGTQPVAMAAWSMLMASSPLGSSTAMRAPCGRPEAAMARLHCRTRSCAWDQLRLVQWPVAGSHWR